MSLFWIAAGLLATIACVVVLHRSARAPSPSARPELDVYRRQLAELDDLKARGLMDEAGHASAVTEAGRRLLKAGDAVDEPEREGLGPWERRSVLVGAVGAVVAAVALYGVVGRPGAPDQPYGARVAAWREAPPQALDAPRLAAVLEAVSREKPQDPQVWSFLGQVRVANGDALGAERAFRRAVELAPRSPEAWSTLGEARVELNGGKVGPDARQAFRQALALSPQDPSARYFLGRGELEGGRPDEAVRTWRALAADLPAGDPRRAAIEAEIERAAKPPTAGASERRSAP